MKNNDDIISLELKKIKTPRDFGALSSLSDLKEHNKILVKLQENINVYQNRFFQSQIISSIDEILERINPEDYSIFLKNSQKYLSACYHYCMTSSYTHKFYDRNPILDGTLDNPKLYPGREISKASKHKKLETYLKSFSFSQKEKYSVHGTPEANLIIGFILTNDNIIPIFWGYIDSVKIKNNILTVDYIQEKRSYRTHEFNRLWEYNFCMKTNKYLYTKFQYIDVDRRY